jgi:pyridinium-3,5-bisthiocarboxylic acid mononucleotide nickel chelatase
MAAGDEDTVLVYLDCFSGISGDMLLGALVDAGVDPAWIIHGLQALPLTGFNIEVEPMQRNGLRGTQVRVVVGPEATHVERNLADVTAIIDGAGLPERVRERALAVFRRLAEAEAHVHGVPVEHVHFHEVGAVDAIVDIVGIMLGLEQLRPDAIYCSDLPFTSGRVRTAHGDLPVPAPATVELLRASGAVWRPLDAEGELVTPTGAAVIAELAQFKRPVMHIERVGYGFGRRELPWANCLRLVVGEAAGAAGGESSPFESDVVAVIETHIDDMTGEALGWLMDRLFDAGALDVTYAPIAMKKNRPATRITVVADPARSSELAQMLLRESTTLGVRVGEMSRVKARRMNRRIETRLGLVDIKIKLIGSAIVSVSAEFDDARRLAEEHGISVTDAIAVIEASGREQYHLPRTRSGEA